MRRIGGLDVAGALQPIVPCADPWRYRNKVAGPAWRAAADVTRPGWLGEGASHSLQPCRRLSVAGRLSRAHA